VRGAQDARALTEKDGSSGKSSSATPGNKVIGLPRNPAIE
jgi:hypothetical protein